MSDSIASLEAFIQSRFDQVKMATDKPAGYGHQVEVTSVPETPSAPQQRSRPVFSFPCLPSTPSINVDSTSKLSGEEQRICNVIINKLSSWIGETVYGFQRELNEQFDKAMEEMKAQMLEMCDSHINNSSSQPQVTDLNGMEMSLENQSQEVEDVKKVNDELRDRCLVLEGRLTRAEKEVGDLKEEMLLQQARSMKDNLKFFNIPEEEDEECEETLRNFLKVEMKVNAVNMNKIHFDRVHRIGAPQRQMTEDGLQRHRPIVAKFNPYVGKSIVLQHITKLDKKKGFGVNDQLPREMDERKKQLLPLYKQAKDNKKNPKWSMDKVVVGGEVRQVAKDKVRDINVDTTDQAINLQERTRHSPPQNVDGSSFQGHAVDITNQDDIIPALHALYSDSRVARASHNIYAYRLKSGNGFIEHYEDDREWGAGRMLLELLKKNGRENELVCVTRWYGGKRLGRKRFDHISSAAKHALQIG